MGRAIQAIAVIRNICLGTIWGVRCKCPRLIAVKPTPLEIAALRKKARSSPVTSTILKTPGTS